MKKLTFIILTTFLFLGCKHEKAVFQNPEFVKAETAAAKLTEVKGACDCLTAAQISACTGNATQAAVINQFLNGNSSITQTVHWGICTTSGSTVTDPSCNFPYTNVTSQLTLCWNSCTTVSAKFTGKPPCLPCYPENFCMILTVTKTVSGGATTYVMQGNTAINDIVQIKLVISTDPDVLVTCGVGPAGNQTIYTCNGSY
ncbi:MAG: hypothetical protein H0W73_15940 [Bacteroidetes bacterium]|nr:hypothetical protein [Bacteroidota bacterium]